MVCWSQESLFILIYKWDIGCTLKIIWWGKINPITSDAIPQNKVLPLFWHQDNFREEEVKLTTFCFLFVPQLDKSRDLRQFEKVHTATKEINFHSPHCLWLYSSVRCIRVICEVFGWSDCAAFAAENSQIGVDSGRALQDYFECILIDSFAQNDTLFCANMPL